jgi:drug/metabolite transporter (DMT)-like permease
MSSPASAPRPLVLLSFAAIYLIWGSTYFFIREALYGFPPMLLGGFRFLGAGLLLLGWCVVRGIPVRLGRADLKLAVITGICLALIGNGAVVWAEQSLPSGVVAIMIAIVPLWMVLLDRPQWAVNFRSPSTLLGVLTGFIGVLLLFSDRMGAPAEGQGSSAELIGLCLLIGCTFCWATGSLYAKHHPASVPAAVSIGWQMALGGIFFLIAATVHGEWAMFDPAAVPTRAWTAMAYLMVFGSLVAFSAYVWLLSVRPATQVSTYAYVNPVVAVLLGAYVGHEHISPRELMGLGVILGSVLLINLAKYRKRA